MANDQSTSTDKRIESIVAAVIEIMRTDAAIRVAIAQGRKADVTIYLHRGEVARPPQIVFHPVDWQ